ncbi:MULTISPECIES: hypothetical protein [Variovorax]|jgi:hypothetical protein|uniref:hypothetical protein n=1 Tax=Variovorax TaxID=34072 RepID=UPI00089D307B|nr:MULTISPECIES: hypothetical protein [Variovorax]MDQ0080590.1 hypothetical protein [Variovorax boronicumulans]SDX59342.1 hypothetical protein SAMN05518669_105316 [Variovorax sp. YR634]SDY74146.1 hypothetical protein SAMN05518854_102418 [Variovorax sp. YR266]SOD28220.1 hypothetical protein SAMN05518800_3790 [Variovorax sp. YR752]
MLFRRILRLLNVPGFGSRQATESQLGRIRTAMLSVLQGHGGHSVQRVSQRVRFAADVEALWYLRQDVMMALSAIDGETAARRQMKTINSMFKGGLPGSMGPRAHQRFTNNNG